MTTATYWVTRWRDCLPPPADACARAHRLGADLARYQYLARDFATVEQDLVALLAATDGQILTTLPGVAVVRAAAFAAHSLPIDRYPDAEHLYSATGLAPRCTNRPPCPDVAGSHGRAWPNTATR